MCELCPLSARLALLASLNPHHCDGTIPLRHGLFGFVVVMQQCRATATLPQPTQFEEPEIPDIILEEHVRYPRWIDLVHEAVSKAANTSGANPADGG